MARISFRQGIIRTHANALQFTSGNQVILLDGQTMPVQLCLADGPDDDYLWEEATIVNPAWTNLPTANEYWLYLDIDAFTGLRTFGTTIRQPLDQPNTPPNPAVDQHWFDTRSSYTKMNVWVGTKWVSKIRIFLAKVTGTLIQQYSTGSQVGLNETVYAGKILYDNENKIGPIKKFDKRGRGKFVTTESPIFSQFSNIAGFKVAQAFLEGQAVEPIPEYSAVAFQGERQIGLAKNGTSLLPFPGPYSAIGVTTEDFATGEVRTFITNGYLTDDNFNWTDPPGTKVFVGPEGQLITSVPQYGSVQVVGTIVDQYTILIDIQPIILYDNP